MNWKEFLSDVVSATKAYFSDLIKNHADEGLYAFILYTDADCYTILPSANSQKKYEEKVLKKCVTDQKRLASYKWYIGEWAYEAWNADGFADICERLSEASEAACEKGSIVEFKRNVHACMIKALSILDEEGFFGPVRKDAVLFVSSTDYDVSIELENSSAKTLNDAITYNKFLKRYEV